MSQSSPAQSLPPLIPREVLFGNPDRVSPRLSPDGKLLGYIAPDEGVLNVWVRTLGQNDDRPITRDRDRGIRFFGWTQNSDQVLYIQDKGGDENWHVYATDLASQETRDLTPLENVQARIVDTHRDYPDEILLSHNGRNPQLHDVFRVNTRTGESTLVAENPGDVLGFMADTEFTIRGALTNTPDAGQALKVRDSVESEWREVLRWSLDDSANSNPVSFTGDGKAMHILSSQGANTARLQRLDLSSGETTTLAHDERADIDGVLIHPDTHEIQAVAVDYDRQHWQVLDPEVQADFDALARVSPGEFSITSRDHSDQQWIVAYSVDNGPVRYYHYDRTSRTASFLFVNNTRLEPYTLAPMQPVEIKSRDGLTLVSYLTLPVGVEAKGLPMVLYVHGGPWARDSWGYSAAAQWLANRGYAVLQVNFRGSTGFGKDFTNAANGEWAAKMHDDLVDAVQWSVDQGYADPARVAIMGGSYGGYATLVGLTYTPDLFAAGVDIVGPSNLITLMESIPPYWEPVRKQMELRIGGSATENAEFLKSRSPLFKAQEIKKPLLIGQGANDPRVKQAESEQIVDAMRKANLPVEYLLFPDEGHGFAKPENRLKFFAATEEFLAKHLGGRAEAA
ncbi:S9 family peptidase [Leptolyngbya sp. FACHB-261]|uniref:S9 family peptidase n=1 Tax=Leptolyngbya sp. FACHB-261 TaxID=2692806 RepID=UPI001681D013|nr:S9 family peptidase [Leptolyngbya sp. FACHB-261]MBD2102107.1 S9 family peptidase [Leptolyngbya sp. FACHB-261]